MADTRNTSLLETFLSINDSKAELTSRLKLQEVSRLSRTCTGNHTLFKQTLCQAGAAKLLDLAIKAEWNKMEKLVALNPSFMFQPADGIDIDGTMIECSPLQYLLYVHDYFGQEIFETCARTHNLLKEFVAHTHTQQTEFDLKPFYEVYETYLASLKLWETRHPTVTETGLNEYWQKQVGGAQLSKLPRHMLRQMCAKVQDLSDWNLQSEFNVRRPLQSNSFDYYWYAGSPHIELTIGVNCALARGLWWEMEMTLLFNTIHSPVVLSHDLAVFKHLFEVRQKQQLNRISMLERELTSTKNIMIK